MSAHDTAGWERTCELFDELLDLDAPAIAERLRQLRVEDAELALELERMLAADRDGGVLDQGMGAMSPTLASGLSAPSAPPGPALAPGDAVGPFRLHEMLGRGGMGEVYRAERVGEGYAQTVAIKLLRRGVDSADVVRRFMQERRILARLEHPGIARLIDGGMSENGLPWLAMELVDGEPITAYAQRHALGLRERIGLLIAVCEALDYAHRRLIVHRDLKPSNVLVGADGAPRLLDFGIAKLLDQPEGDDLTGTGVRVLSPAYASPEQIAGEPIGIATDVYALGLLLYELLTAELPHARRRSNLASIARNLATEPERPSACVRRSVAADTTIAARTLEGDLDTIALKALASEPDRRYASAAALAEDLRRYREGRPIAARADTLGYRLGKFVRRHRGGVALGALAALGIVTALFVALWQAGVARREAARAERETAAALESAARTKRVKDFLMQTFTPANPLRSPVDAPQTLAGAVDDALERVDRDLGDDPTLQIDLLDDFGEIRTGQGRFDDALALFTRALALAEATYGPDHPAVAESLLNLSTIDIFEERFLDAVPKGERLVAILERHADVDPLALVNGLGMLSVLRNVQGRREEAVALTARALEIQRRHGKPGDPLLDLALHNHGVNLNHVGRPAEAEPLIRESLAMREKALGVDNPTLGYSLSALSSILYQRGEIAESATIDERRVAIARKAFPGPHAWKADALSDLGWQRIAAGRMDEGYALLDEAIDIYTGLESAEVVRALRFRAIGKRRAGDNDAALAAIERAWAVCQQNAELAVCGLIRANRAGLLARTGQATLALAEADLAIAALQANEHPDITEVAQALESKAWALAVLGRQSEAQALQQQALASYRKSYGDAHPETQHVRDGVQKLSEIARAPQ